MRKSVSMIILHLFLTIIILTMSIGSSLQDQSVSSSTDTIIAANELRFERFPDLTPIISSIDPSLLSKYSTTQNTNDQENIPLSLDRDTRVTLSNDDDAHPSIDIDYQGNPLILYDSTNDNMDFDILIKKSTDKGLTWPDVYTWDWAREETSETYPDLSFMEDGIRAFGTHDSGTYDPILFFHDYVNIDDPSSWTLYSLDFAPQITYIKETAITTHGSNIIVIGCIVGLSYLEYNLDDTLLIVWNTEGGVGSWPGLFLINEDSEGNTRPISTPSATSGNKLYLSFQIEEIDDRVAVYVAYCPPDDVVFENWDNRIVTNLRSNSINSNIYSNEDYTYLVVQDDWFGSQDIYCYFSKSVSFWNKNIVVDSSADEMYPVVIGKDEDATCLFIRNGNLYKTETSDGGIIWTNPEQVNDEDGTVVQEYGSVDISGKYAIWTDNRNGNKDLYFEEVRSLPELMIEGISGGLKVKAYISNVGNAPAENTKWTLKLNGFIVPESKSGYITTLEPGESRRVETDFVFGFGSFNLLVIAGDISESVSGIAFGSFVVIQ